MKPNKIIVALTGASGIDYGIEVVNTLIDSNIQTYVILSKWAEEVIEKESQFDLEEFKKGISYLYNEKNMSASISSSSTLIDGMVVIPATVKTVSNIAQANTENLIARTADIMLKMRKPLIIGIRETPLSSACLKNLYQLSKFGAIILPLSPGFYHKPKIIQELLDYMTGKVLDCLNIPNTKITRWNEITDSK